MESCKWDCDGRQAASEARQIRLEEIHAVEGPLLRVVFVGEDRIVGNAALVFDPGAPGLGAPEVGARGTVGDGKHALVVGLVHDCGEGGDHAVDQALLGVSAKGNEGALPSGVCAVHGRLTQYIRLQSHDFAPCWAIRWALRGLFCRFIQLVAKNMQHKVRSPIRILGVPRKNHALGINTDVIAII